MSDRLVFSKSKQARYISHLDLMRTFQRAFNRAGIGIRHTEGFNPHPFVSIALPLSVGFSSDCEILEFGLASGATHEDLPEKLTAAMPEGIEISHCYSSEIKLKHLIYVDYRITLDYDGGVPEGAVVAWQDFLAEKSCVIQKKSKKARSGFTEIDIMPMIHGVTFDVKEKCLTLNALLTAQNPGLNPNLMVSAFSGKYSAFTPNFVQCHRVRVLDKEKKVFS